MLTSLFGELRNLRVGRKSPAAPAAPVSTPDEDDSSFAATVIMSHPIMDRSAFAAAAAPVATRAYAVAPLTTRSDADHNRVRDLVVTGSSSNAIREHFAKTRSDLSAAKRQITLLDPTRMWAPDIIQALSYGDEKSAEKLHLREQGTLRTLAMIERAVITPHGEESVRIYHADIRVPDHNHQNIPYALMERSHLSVVMVGSMGVDAVQALLRSLYSAMHKSRWLCPTVLFMLPSNGVWIANKIAMIDWPSHVRIQTINETHNTSAQALKSLMGMWNRAKLTPAILPPIGTKTVFSNASSLGLSLPLLDLSEVSQPQPLAAGLEEEPATELHLALRMDLEDNAAPAEIDATSIHNASSSLRSMLTIEGLIGCAVVDTRSGQILSRHITKPSGTSLEQAAARSAQVLRAHQFSSDYVGTAAESEEITTCSGNKYHMVRTSPSHPGLFLFAVLEKENSNLALARYKLKEAELCF
jgi:hypothetical protein